MKTFFEDMLHSQPYLLEQRRDAKFITFALLNLFQQTGTSSKYSDLYLGYF